MKKLNNIIFKFYIILKNFIKLIVKKLDLLIGGYIHKIYDYFHNPDIFSLNKIHQRKITLFYNCNYNLLSKLSTNYNSDKGSDTKKLNRNKFGYEAHTYTDFYSILFDNLKEHVKLVFECGILYGASLRVWRDYFINAEIFGGDINKDFLFKEDRINTFYVDQTSSDTIKEMWRNINKKNFDIIIDDGLHTNEANFKLFNESFKFLKKNGIYIIEDVSNENLITLLNDLNDYNPQVVVLKSIETRWPNNNLIMISKL